MNLVRSNLQPQFSNRKHRCAHYITVVTQICIRLSYFAQLKNISSSWALNFCGTPKSTKKHFHQTGTLELLGRKKFGLCCTALSERQKLVENPNVSLQPWRSQNVKFVIFLLNFREVAWNLRDLRGLRGTCVEPAWPAWNLRAWHLRGLRGTCVACVEPAWNLRGLRGTCVEPACVAPAWPACNLRGTCAACAAPPAWKNQKKILFAACNSKKM